MPTARRSSSLLICVAIVSVGGSVSAAEGPAVSFARDVLPLLAKNCFACHGPDEAHREAELRLDVRDDALRELPSGARAVVPNKPAASELLARITSDDADLRMPPAKHGKPLTKEQVETLRRWIADGASYAKHWSFVAPVAAELPKVKNIAWPTGGVDRFILARLEAEQLKPNDEADRPTLIRRLSLDLRGLPPTIAEVREFVDDKRPDAYERLVDRLLADRAFGERWARPWLDLARYADSRGYGSDPLRLNIWPYRDWVIGALNRDLPYDQFTIEQIAGDLLPKPTTEQLTATAFHRNTMTNTEGGTDDEEFRVAAVNDRTHVTMQVWMGLTMGCAKCHNHKYDPISQKEYYRTFAVFNQTEDADRPDESPTLPLPDPDEASKQKQRDKLKAEIAELKKQIEADKQAADAAAKEKKPLDDKTKQAAEKRKTQLAGLERSLAGIKSLDVPVLRELPNDKRRPTHVLLKGNFLNKGEPVEPGLPTAFHKPPAGEMNRLALARWLVDRQNPLTARVAVNRVWAQLFGIGLVETEEDFGVQGTPPSHPELLDWLAVRFMDGNSERGTRNAERQTSTPTATSKAPSSEFRAPSSWSLKQLIKLIVTSRTYRQSSHVSDLALARDPRNRLLSHAPRVRLDAETVRDQALAAAGLLSRKIGGPSVFPPQPAGMWQAAFNGERTWSTSAGEDKYRRGLYTFWRRTVPYPSMATFDAPSREICAVRRIRTNTPLQALVTLNDPVYVEAAQALARRIVREGGSSPEERIRYALLLTTSRPARDEQVSALSSLYHDELKHYAADRAAAKQLATDPLGPLPQGADEAEAAAWTVVANVLLNLDAVLTRG